MLFKLNVQLLFAILSMTDDTNIKSVARLVLFNIVYRPIIKSDVAKKVPINLIVEYKTESVCIFNASKNDKHANKMMLTFRTIDDGFFANCNALLTFSICLIFICILFITYHFRLDTYATALFDSKLNMLIVFANPPGPLKLGIPGPKVVPNTLPLTESASALLNMPSDAAELPIGEDAILKTLSARSGSSLQGSQAFKGQAFKGQVSTINIYC
jgi:hypothetical protein